MCKIALALAVTAVLWDGIPSDHELTDYLREDAQISGLPAPVAKVCDFSLQREINRELGVE